MIRLGFEFENVSDEDALSALRRLHPNPTEGIVYFVWEWPAQGLYAWHWGEWQRLVVVDR